MSADDEDYNDEEEYDEDEDGNKDQEVDPESLENGQVTIVVGEWSKIKSVTQALEQCKPKDYILCTSGEYDEKIVLNKSEVDIAGPTDMSCIIKQGITSTCSFSSINNLCVKGGIDIKCGNLAVTECDIMDAKNGIQVFQTANPKVTRCTVHDIEKHHIYVYPGGDGIFEGNELSGDGRRDTVGLYLNDAAKTVFQGNTITNTMLGVYTNTGCKGVQILENKINDCTGNGVQVDGKSKPNIKQNEIKNSEHYGIVVGGDGAGVFANNIIHGSVKIASECRPSFFDNFVVIPGKVVNKDEVFALKGLVYKRVEDLPKPRKPKPEPEE